MAAAVAACMAAAVTCTGGAARSLRWDGQAWLLGDDDAVPGRVTAVVDLGDWMLLRFDAASAVPSTRPPRRRWLPVQRRGTEGEWHALRCAVHAPAPVPPTP